MAGRPSDAVRGNAATMATATSRVADDEARKEKTTTRAASLPPSVAPLTDTQLLQLALRNAVASAAAGKATVSAHNYALVLKIIFRKCFLLDELVLLALSMGREARRAEEATATPAHDPRAVDHSGGTAAATQDEPPIAADAAQQLVNAIKNIGMLLPPGLDDEDYSEERAYVTHKDSGEEHVRRQRASTHPTCRAAPVSLASTADDDSEPGHDAETAQWLACLLAKVRSDALPISTLNKINKACLTNKLARSSSTAGHQQVTEVTARTSAAPVYSGLPHLMSSPTRTLSGMASPTGSPNRSDGTAALTASLPVLFATLLWNTACALWNEGFIEDAHHWLSVMDVQGLWKLHRDLCRCSEASSGGGSGDLPAAAAAPSSSSSSTRFGPSEPFEDDAHSENRACPLSWPAVLEESCAADEPTLSHPSAPPSATKASHSKGSEEVTSPANTRPGCTTWNTTTPTVGSGITLSAVATHCSPLPITDPAACFDDVEWLEGNKDEKDYTVTGDDAASGATSSSPKTHRLGAGGGSADTDTSAASLACYVRRLARRTSALRDLCGLMIACETAEDVFYVLYALNYALATQQRKYKQQQQQQQQEEDRHRVDEAVAVADDDDDDDDHESTQPMGPETPSTGTGAATRTTSGGLPEVLIITNLLVEFFIAKRAQQLLLEDGELHHVAAVISTVGSPFARPQHNRGGARAPHPLLPHQQRLTDRAIRRACDEVVCAFTNGHCLSLYALESYGIPPPYGDDDNNTLTARLLAPELPHVLIINVLSSTLNYATLYHCSKVFHGVMKCPGVAAAHSYYDPNVGCASLPSSATAAVVAAAAALSHPNRTRRATEEEMQRRRMWTRLPETVTTSETPRTKTLHATSSLSPTDAVKTIAEGLAPLETLKAGWRYCADVVARSTMSGMGSGAKLGAQDHPHPHHKDVRPNFFMGGPPGEDSLLRLPEGGGYAERIAAARREHQAAMHCDRRIPSVESTVTPPWSAGSATTMTTRNSCDLEDARGVNSAYLRKAGVDAHRDGGGSYRSELRTRGGVAVPGLLLPCSSSLSVPLLPEEREIRGLQSDMGERVATEARLLSTRTRHAHPLSDVALQHQQQCQHSAAVASATVLHTAAVQLQSRTPCEAVSLRLLTLLYRYPLLHTLQPVTASHVHLVARELNKGLHILQTAMRTRFGDVWWMQWRSKREGETQSYYARALADAQRGSSLFGSSRPLTASPPPTEAGATSVTPGVQEQLPPPRMTDMSALQRDASLIFTEAPPWQASLSHPQGTTTEARGPEAVGLHGSHLTSAPPPQQEEPSRGETFYSALWNTNLYRGPADEVRHRSRRGPWPKPTTSATTPIQDATTEAVAAASAYATTKPCDAHEVDIVYDVDWDVPPAYTPEVSLDFSAFTTTSVETQESTRQLVESLQQRERLQRNEDGDDDDDDDVDHSISDETSEAPGVCILSRACRRLLHDELPSLQQYSPWRVIYSTRIHGVSLSTLFANCRREVELDFCRGNMTTSADTTLPTSKPMMLLLELPSSTSHNFDEDAAGVRNAWAQPGAHKQEDGGCHVHNHDCSHGCTNNSDGKKRTKRNNKLFIGAFLSDPLQPESRRYYGDGNCFVFQLLVPGTSETEATETGASDRKPRSSSLTAGATAASSTRPQLRVHHSSHHNTHYINCRSTSIVIGGGDGGSSIYLDSSLRHGATSACATFSSPPLSTWASERCTAADGEGDSDEGQKSLCVINVEVIVMDG